MRTGSRGTIVSTGKLVECFGRNGMKWNEGRSLISGSRKNVRLPEILTFLWSSFSGMGQDLRLGLKRRK